MSSLYIIEDDALMKRQGVVCEKTNKENERNQMIY